MHSVFFPQKNKSISEPLIIYSVSVYLDSVLRGVEEANAADAVEDGVTAVLQHVVSADGGQTLSLGGEDGTLHYGEVLFI